MNICPILRYNNYNNIHFTSKVVKIGMGNVPEDLQKKVDIFEETEGKNATPIGEGLQAYAYRFNGTKYVIKASKEGKARVINGDFSKEANSLRIVPEDFNHAQKLIGNVQTEDGNWYLLSTFVGGEIPNGESVKWSKDSLRSLMSSLAELDVSQVYHGDVSKCNCLITDDNEVNLLDFQYAEKFDFKGEEAHKTNAEKYKVPYFIAPSNLQMFEESTFGTYLSELKPDEARSLFQDYLEEKSTYHKKRAEGFKKLGAREEIVEYEELMSKFLKNPSLEVTYLQAEKMQILMAHRNVLSAIDGFMDITSAVPYYLYAIQRSNIMAETAEFYAREAQDPELKKFYEYQAKDAAFYRSAMKNELDGRYGKSSAFEWILRNAKLSPNNEWDDISPRLYKMDGKACKPVPDVKKTLIRELDTFGFMDERKDEVTDNLEHSISKLRKTQAFHVAKKSRSHEIIQDYHKLKTGLMNDLKQSHDKYTEGGQFEALYYSLNALFKASILNKRAHEYSSNPTLNSDERFRMKVEGNFFEEYTKELEETNRRMYARLFEDASEKLL